MLTRLCGEISDWLRSRPEPSCCPSLTTGNYSSDDLSSCARRKRQPLRNASLLHHESCAVCHCCYCHSCDHRQVSSPTSWPCSQHLSPCRTCSSAFLSFLSICLAHCPSPICLLYRPCSLCIPSLVFLFKKI